MTQGIEKTIAEKVAGKGGKAYYVGGYVRDRLLGLDCHDIDIEVHGIKPEELYSILLEVGEPQSFGKNFGIYSLKGYDIDIAMPRKEEKSGRGHRDFEVFVDPFLGPEKAAVRRDFTMNALMEDVLTGEITDPFNGADDIKKGIIRHIDDKSFVEDPLRVLRAAGFAARFGFKTDDKTIQLCRGIDLSQLSKERVNGELKKALLKSSKPSVFFELLREMDQLGVWFPELMPLIGLEQDPVFHPEGDVWTHTMLVLDKAAAYRDNTSNPYAFMLLCLTHDFGKAVSTGLKNGRIHAYSHESKGIPIISGFLNRLLNEHAVIQYVLNMALNHMRPNMLAYSNASVKSSKRMFDEAASADDLVYFAICDKSYAGSDEDIKAKAYLENRLDVYKETMRRPYVTGKDLISAGIKQDKNFGEILAFAHKLRLAGIDKKSTLKQCIAMSRKNGKG